jgi:hypothetical protein
MIISTISPVQLEDIAKHFCLIIWFSIPITLAMHFLLMITNITLANFICLNVCTFQLCLHFIVLGVTSTKSAL